MGKKRGWVQKRTTFEKVLLSISVILFLTVLILILIRVFSNGDSSESGVKGKRCWSRECIQTAGRVLSMLDETVDPCSNFYAYACGGYSQTHLADISVQDTAADLVRLQMKSILESSFNAGKNEFDSAKSLYDSCMKFDGLRDDGALRDLMHKLSVGTWPLIDTFFDVDSRLSLAERLSALSLLGVDIAFRLDVVPNPRLPGHALLKISAGGPKDRGRSSAAIRDDNGLKIRTFHAFLLLGAEHTHARTDATDILFTDAHYAHILHDEETPCDPVDILSANESVRELERLVPEMKWTALMSMIEKEVHVSMPFGIELHCKNKIRDYLVYLHDLPNRISYNYLGWRFFSVFERHLRPDSMGSGQASGGRWRQCVQLLETYAPSLFASVLNPAQDITKELSNITKSALSVADNSIGNANWLNSNQRHRIQTKILPESSDLSFLQNHLFNSSSATRIPQVHESNYSSVVILLQKEMVMNEIRKLNSSVADVVKINHSSSSPSAALASQIATFRAPYFNPQGSDWMNFGGYGVSYSKQLSDFLLSLKTGSSPDDHTSVWDIWFKGNSKCLLDQFAKATGLSVEELHTNDFVKDLFLDSSSLQIAYEGALKAEIQSKVLPGLEELSDEQYFFLSYAQTQCKRNSNDQAGNDGSDFVSMEKRVNTAVNNLHAFRKAFNCEKSEPPIQCQIWT